MSCQEGPGAEFILKAVTVTKGFSLGRGTTRFALQKGPQSHEEYIGWRTRVLVIQNKRNGRTGKGRD